MDNTLTSNITSAETIQLQSPELNPNSPLVYTTQKVSLNCFRADLNASMQSREFGVPAFSLATFLGHLTTLMSRADRIPIFIRNCPAPSRGVRPSAAYQAPPVLHGPSNSCHGHFYAAIAQLGRAASMYSISDTVPAGPRMLAPSLQTPQTQLHQLSYPLSLLLLHTSPASYTSSVAAASVDADNHSIVSGQTSSPIATINSNSSSEEGSRLVTNHPRQPVAVLQPIVVRAPPVGACRMRYSHGTMRMLVSPDQAAVAPISDDSDPSDDEPTAEEEVAVSRELNIAVFPFLLRTPELFAITDEIAVTAALD
ncbi:unnamed protein product [Orchesella dallaii]|uniref:Uncharacterized protein n=1 Tax=Orchesella dallaii TaxID=48710 RepID=A0ABP1PVM3_9HEXA